MKDALIEIMVPVALGYSALLVVFDIHGILDVVSTRDVLVCCIQALASFALGIFLFEKFFGKRR